MTLESFEGRADALRHQADALVAAANLQVGFAESRSVLERLAHPLTQALEKILRHSESLDERSYEQIEAQRTHLLALVQEGTSALGADPGAENIAQQSEFIKRWTDAEERIAKTLGSLCNKLRTEDTDLAVSQAAVHQQIQHRVEAVTGDSHESWNALRRAVGLGESRKLPAQHHAERLLKLLKLPRNEVPVRITTGETLRMYRGNQSGAGKAGAMGAGLVAVSIIIGLLTGWAVVATQEQPTTAFGRTLTGDQPLADLRIYGDPEQIPDYAVEPISQDAPDNRDPLTLEAVREHMARAAEAEERNRALMPDHLELTVALLPIEDYVDNVPRREVITGQRSTISKLRKPMPRFARTLLRKTPRSSTPALERSA